jgi:peptidoglycan/LPS O-acetylase OafA/YrhL
MGWAGDASRDRAANKRGHAFVPEIQALRAVAVGLVVVFHLWPGRLAGGFVGVDAFFVISGLLITSHLMRDVQRTGGVHLASFYARRARRLLPAASVVLLFCGSAGYLLLPPESAMQNVKEVVASTFYAQNLYLAHNAVTYSASDNVASTVQHFWSLSAEEQFYLVWPGLILASIVLARRWWGTSPRTAVTFVLSLVTVASVAFSVVQTRRDPASAYFVTSARAWEFGVGALLALIPGPGLSLRAKVLLRWLGLAGLGTAALFLSASTPFPGFFAALPVLGTAMVLLAGDTGRGDPTSHLVAWKPVQWLGDVSYSLYLWHWPLIVLAPHVLGRNPGLVDRAGILLLTLGLAHASYKLVEPIGRSWSRIAQRPRPALAVAAATMAGVTLVSGAQLLALERTNVAVVSQSKRVLDDPCAGAAALENPAGCPGALTKGPNPPVTKADAPWSAAEGCGDMAGTPKERHCSWGEREPSKTVALVGDSHAEAWRNAVFEVAKAENWAVVEMYLGGCPATYAQSVSFWKKPRPASRCSTWTKGVTARLRTLKPDMIITTGYVVPHTFEPKESGPEGFRAVWADWTEFATVHVIRDLPLAQADNGPRCLSVNRDNVKACAAPRDRAIARDAMVRAAEAEKEAGNGRLRLLDFSDQFCDSTTCYAVLGEVPVYYDRSHMTKRFSLTLVPYLHRALTQAK